MMKHYFGYGVLALIALAALYWLHSQEVALAIAAERAKTQDKIIQSSQAAIASIEQARQQAIADLEAERKKPATVETIVKQLAGLSGPRGLGSTSLPTGSAVKVEQLPDAPAPQVVLSGDAQTNLNFIRDQLLDHRECDVNLAACDQKLTEQGKELIAAVNQRDIWKQAAQGGSKTHRMVKMLKVIGCAGGGAALGSLWKARGAAIGGAAGAGACEVIF